MTFAHLSKKIVAGTLITMMCVTSFGMAPKTAEATFPVVRTDNFIDMIGAVEQTAETIFSGEGFIKEYTLDGIATGLAKAALRSVIVSTLNWVASGFEGSPAFVRDLNTNLRQVGDAAVSQLAGQILQRAVDTPFRSAFATGVFAGYYLATSADRIQARLENTLQRFSQNPSRFLYGDFSQGGWSAWYQTNTTCGNNQYCFQIAVHDEIISRVEAEVDQRLRELEWGNGFLSWRGDCTISGTVDESGATTTVGKSADGVTLNDGEVCLQNEINTPGSVIHDQIESAVGSDIAQLVSADELNEAIAGLLNSLLQKAIGSGGLAGGSSGGGGGSGGGVTTAPNVAAAFTRSLGLQREKVTEYQADWRKVSNAAEEAKAALESCNRDGNAELLEDEVEPALERAEEALTKAAAALAALDDLEERAAESAARLNAGFEQIVADYQELMASDIMPTSAEIIESLKQSQDMVDVQPPSLYNRMKDITESACSIFRN